MPKAVRFDEYGGIDLLEVRDVSAPVAGPGQAVVAVRAAATNPGEAATGSGALHDRWPATFPSGQGSDLAGGGVLRPRAARHAGKIVPIP